MYAVGRLGRAPEAALALDYAARATAGGRALGLGPVEIVEVEARKPGKAAEGEALLGAIGADVHIIAAAVVVARRSAAAFASRAFADRIAKLRDQGVRRLAFVVGGADGLSPEVLARADAKLAFGPQTWPHALARAMLAEQVYRAVTIMSGGPYHRD